MVIRYLPFAYYRRCRIDIAFDNGGFAGMLRVQRSGVNHRSLERHDAAVRSRWPATQGDSIMNIRDANKVDAPSCGRILYDAFNALAESYRR